MERRRLLDMFVSRAFAASSRPVTRDLGRQIRPLTQGTGRKAIAHPITAAGPPPEAPRPAASQYGERIDRRRRQAEMLKQGQEMRASQQSKKSGPLKKRFWKDVSVKETPGGLQIFLDNRPVRTPTKAILTIPTSKPHLAFAIALEWDLLVSAQQALKSHLIPMTSIASRAEAIVEEEVGGGQQIREDILRTVMRYLDTDTLLCLAPERVRDGRAESLRDIQIRTAQPIIAFLAAEVWPGVEIKPVLDEDTIIPPSQPEMTKNIIKGWISGLPAYELAALERGVLATKSLLVATRLLVDWSAEFRHLQGGGRDRFGVEQAAKASTLEVAWQTGEWGEVEDTHDVEKEDLKRQLGSAVLLVAGGKP